MRRVGRLANLTPWATVVRHAKDGARLPFPLGIIYLLKSIRRQMFRLNLDQGHGPVELDANPQLRSVANLSRISSTKLFGAT